jgi:hypothetical protein
VPIALRPAPWKTVRMGFSEGWSKALDQLVAAAKTM